MVHTFSFPGLGLSFSLDRVAFTVFGRSIYWYGVIIAVGFLLAVLYACKIAPRFGVEPDSVIDMLFFAVPLSIVGARVYYVVFNLSRFQDPDGSLNWGAAVAIWDGGGAIYGSIIAAVLTVVVFCKVRGCNTWAMMDVGCYGLLIGQAVGRWGNFVNMEAFGGITAVPWRMSGAAIAEWLLRQGKLPDAASYDAIADGTLGVHPTFFYESAWNVLGLLLLILLAKKCRKCDGQMFLSYVIWYGVGRFFIEGLRTDSLYFFSTGIRVSQMLALCSALAALAVLIWRLRKAGPAAPPLAAEPAQAAAPADSAAPPPAAEPAQAAAPADSAAPPPAPNQAATPKPPASTPPKSPPAAPPKTPPPAVPSAPAQNPPKKPGKKK